MIEAPQHVLYTVPSETHVQDALLAEELLPAVIAPVKGLAGLTAPEVGDTVANHNHIKIAPFLSHAQHLFVPGAPVVEVTLLRAGLISSAGGIAEQRP